MEWTKHRKRRSGRKTDTEGVTGSNGNGNSKTRPFTKIVSFSINNITSHNYSMQLTTKMMKLMNNLIKKFWRPKKTKAMGTVILTLNI